MLWTSEMLAEDGPRDVVSGKGLPTFQLLCG